MKAWWYIGDKNWGDILTPVLIERLTGTIPERNLGPGTVLSVGSLFHWLRDHDVIWGTGAISATTVPKPFPRDVRFCAVRGPETRKALLSAGAFDVPEVYGDPALLTPYFFQVPTRPKVDLGVIPHYKDVGHFSVPEGTKIINIKAGITEVIQQVCSCRAIVSSSLHGIILAEAYDIPAAWLQVDGGVRLVGKHFKFVDYLQATNRENIPLVLASGTRLDPDHIPWLPPAQFDAQRLFATCPFNSLGYPLQGIPRKVIP